MIAVGDGFRPRRVLAIGAHSDDIEIGAGGTILSLQERDPDVRFDWVVLAAHGERRTEAAESAQRFVPDPSRLNMRLESFRDRFFPFDPAIKEYFDGLGEDMDPDLILCPWVSDAHQDHRTVAQLASNTFRHHLILSYEIPKVDGDLGRPSLYVGLSAEVAQKKVSLLTRGFPSQHGRRWFDPEVFMGLMRLRGLESGDAATYAEAFYAAKLLLVGAE
jgi:LmbE family N-acetylglucosaminyl deacetylase